MNLTFFFFILQHKQNYKQIATTFKIITSDAKNTCTMLSISLSFFLLITTVGSYFRFSSWLSALGNLLIPDGWLVSAIK